MGRRRRESGHRQGGLPPVKITPKEQGQPLCPPVCPYHATQSLNANLQSPEPRMLERWRFEATDPSSPESGRSGPSQNNFAHSISTSYTGRLAEARHLSPEPPTPTSSSVSAYYLSQNGEHPGRRFRHHESLPRSDPSETGVQKIGVDIIGIESRVSNDDTQQYLGAPPEYLSHRGPLTINQQRLPRTHGPWAPLPFRFEEHYLNTDDTMEGVQDAIPAPEARERGGGGRTGPLSPIGRRQAGDVRRLGACLRCTIMREKCDAQPSCNNCSTKDRRKLPKMCIRARADWAMLKSILFPDELTDRLRGDALFSYLANNSFTVSRRQQFKLSLDINVGRPLLTLMVREFFPLDIPEVQHTYRSLLGADGIVTYGRHQVWSPPINISIERGELPRSIERLRVQIRNMFVQVLDNRDDWDRWAMIYFPETDEDFQTDIIIRVGKYYRSDIPEHSVLKQALSLLWFEHLLLTKARVPADAVAALETKLESRRPAGLPGDARVVPDTINRFIKGVVLPMAEKAGQKLTESLHEMMFKLAVGHMNLTPARMDLCLCLAFVLLIYLAKTQHALLLLADAPANETGREYGVENARERIEQMDDVIAEYVVQFHKYTLTRRSGRSPGGSGGSPADEDSAFEQHAREFDLPGELRALAQEYAHQRPASFGLGELDLGTFRHMNVRRLCWKLFQNVDSE